MDRSLSRERPPWLSSPGSVLKLLLTARIISALCMHITDCDETFNYWEPTHYLLYGSGFQTWEYSPAYTIRSYGYLLLHILPLLATNTTNKLIAFYLLRIILGAACALCEFYFYGAVLERYGRQIARWTLLFLVLSCGMFISSTAYLPSTFSMYCCMLATGAWLKNNYEDSEASSCRRQFFLLAIFAVALSAIVGWPFSAALGLPLALDVIVSKKRPLFFVSWSLLSFIVIAVPLVAVDSFYYGKAVLAPLNILLYNVFGKGGPDLYGVEPWSFYFINGFLNFNCVFILALAAIPLIEIEILLEALIANMGRGYSWRQVFYATLLYYSGRSAAHIPGRAFRVATQPLFIWIAIFFTRPHKEERFLFPVYPLFCLSAAIALQIIPEVLPLLYGMLMYVLKAPKFLKRLALSLLPWLPVLVCITFTVLSISRGCALYKAYHAPMDLYRKVNSGPFLSRVETLSEVNLCVGKEWYRFPSSFFLPNKKWKLRFIRSEFRGQLPQPYSPHKNATWVIPDHMNDMNLEETSRYFELERCHFLVELDLPRAVVTEREPRYTQDRETWEVMASFPFLDSERGENAFGSSQVLCYMPMWQNVVELGKSQKLYRAFYIPWLSGLRTSYADYVLLKNRHVLSQP